MSYKVRDYLRHTFATLALQNGVDVKTVSSMLGHFDAGFTLRTYTPDPEQVQRQEQAAQTSSKLPLYVAVGIAVVCAGIVAAVLISRQLQNTQAQTQKQKDEKSAYHRKKGGK